MKKLLILSMLTATSGLYADFNFEQCSGSGTFEQQIDAYGGDNEKTVYVGAIPAGVKGLHIELNSDKDVDIRLYGENNDKIVHWPNGILNQSGLETKSYKNVSITYSGYNGTNHHPGHEFIDIKGTTPTAMTMKAFGYQAGYATVNYSWTGKEGCEEGGGNGTGHFEQDIPNSDIALVGSIPKDIENLEVNLTSDKDIDIQLYGADGTAIILLNGSGTQTINYHNMHIEWSGYNGVDGHAGHEYIKITGKTTEEITMKVYGYEAGSASVDYSWGKKSPQQELSKNRALWNSSTVKNSYTFEVHGFVVKPALGIHTIYVSNGDVKHTSFEYFDNLGVLDSSPNKFYDTRTIDDYFNMIQETIDNPDREIVVSYNEEFGYPTHIVSNLKDSKIVGGFYEIIIEDLWREYDGICTTQYEPVCGIVNHFPPSNNMDEILPIYKTFGNMCELDVAGAEFAYEGVCHESPIDY